MRLYDFEKAISYINESRNLLKVVRLGILEDWNMTSETVWENGEWTRKICQDNPNQRVRDYVEFRLEKPRAHEEVLEWEDILIAMIPGSSWGTPVMKAKYKNGDEREIPCYVESLGQETENA